MSMLTRELQKSNLAEAGKASLHPNAARSASATSPATRNSIGERGFSNSSIGRDKIEEEQDLFSMEDDDPYFPATNTNSSNAKHADRDSGSKRPASGLSLAFGKASSTPKPT